MNEVFFIPGDHTRLSIQDDLRRIQLAGWSFIKFFEGRYNGKAGNIAEFKQDLNFNRNPLIIVLEGQWHPPAMSNVWEGKLLVQGKIVNACVVQLP